MVETDSPDACVSLAGLVALTKVVTFVCWFPMASAVVVATEVL